MHPGLGALQRPCRGLLGLAAACQGPDIKGFPTWVIGDELIEGEQSFDELEAAAARATQD